MSFQIHLDPKNIVFTVSENNLLLLYKFLSSGEPIICFLCGSQCFFWEFFAGCEVLLTDKVEQRENVSELLSSFFFAGNWKEHANTKKSRITVPIPGGMFYNDSGKLVQSKVNKVRLNLHQQMVAAFDFESVEQVNVNVDQRE